MADTTLTIQMPDAGQLQNEADAALNTASICVVLNDDDLQFATDQMTAMTKRIKELEDVRKSITKPLDTAKKNVMALFKPITESLQTAVGQIKVQISGYVSEKERKLAEERAKAEAEAAATRAALEKKAEEAETPEQAEALREVAALATAAPVPAKIEKVKGLVTKKVWKAKVTDMPAFLVYVATHPELAQCVTVNEAALARYASATGGTVNVPGVEFTQETQVASRG